MRGGLLWKKQADRGGAIQLENFNVPAIQDSESKWVVPLTKLGPAWQE
jgi:hypothetical protein